MLNSFVNSKNIYRAAQATVDPYEAALDSGMDFIEPETPEPLPWGYKKGCFEESPVRRIEGLARTEKKFGVEAVGILDKKRVNGYYRARILCSDGSELYDDLSAEEIETLLPELRKTSVFEEWEAGGYPTDPLIELAFHKEEHKDNLASCILCGRTLTHPKSVARHIGPECLKKVTPSGKMFVRGDEVDQGLIRASQAYAEERFQAWVMKAVLTLDALLPHEILRWRGEEYFGYRNKPSLYYLDITGALNCVEVKKKQLIHRLVTVETCQTPLDRHALKIAAGIAVEAPTIEPEFEVVEVICHSPYLKEQWAIKDGNRQIGVYREINGYLWCNCREPNCRHIQVLKDGGWIK